VISHCFKETDGKNENYFQRITKRCIVHKKLKIIKKKTFTFNTQRGEISERRIHDYENRQTSMERTR
jgi:hypothetical protein